MSDTDAMLALARKALGPEVKVDIREAWPPMWLATVWVESPEAEYKNPEVSVWASTRAQAVRGLKGALRAMGRGKQDADATL